MNRTPMILFALVSIALLAESGCTRRAANGDQKMRVAVKAKVLRVKAKVLRVNQGSTFEIADDEIVVHRQIHFQLLSPEEFKDRIVSVECYPDRLVGRTNWTTVGSELLLNFPVSELGDPIEHVEDIDPGTMEVGGR